MNLETLDAVTWSIGCCSAIFIRLFQGGYVDSIFLFSLLVMSWILHLLNNRPQFRQGAGHGVVCGFLSVPSAVAVLNSHHLHSALTVDFIFCLLFIISPYLVPTTDFRFSIVIPILVTLLFYTITNEDLIVLSCTVLLGLFVLTCLMKYAPGSFSIGEFVMVSTLSSLPVRSIFELSDHLSIQRFSAIFITFGVLCLSLSLLIKRPIVIFIVLFAFILSYREIPTVISYVMNLKRLYLVAYCGIVCIIFIFISAHWKGLQSFPQIIQRKFFHLMALLVFVPPVLIDYHFLRLCISGAIFVFLFVESLRIVRFPYVASLFESYVSGFIDERDSNELILTHLFLLLGLGLPVLLADVTVPGSLAVHVAGISVLAVGDAMASICGVYYGRHKWPGSKKSYEGTAGAFFGTWLTMAIIQAIAVRGVPWREWLCLLLPAIIGALDEAFTSQIDNLTLPFVMIPPIVSAFFFLS
ncbi:phosphatidate cytidylyltransferase family protein [Tritrichomonas foetus]|uniref:dolichol kinase n=1 Tax=Tritrichomonas foetus TaxID=1144522 RepID=A0A1J4K5H9_9EUKA|nr:phosphatidate cytidylyltransferase family protein [Tritrichomonas foetus]|eukprot:OHT06250.1 phosphatidate cytidylyltransferase family protein [Tritrichomonas foetus]